MSTTQHARGSSAAHPIPLEELEPFDLLATMSGGPSRHRVYIFDPADRQVYAFRADFDLDSGPPWENSDGHGPVSDWTTRSPRPGEWILAKDGQSVRYYDAGEATDTARRERWNSAETPEQVQAAVFADFQYLQQWCRSEWQYISLSGAWYTPSGEHFMQSTSGLETSDDGKYLLDVVRELIAEIRQERGTTVLCSCCQGIGIASPPPAAPPTWQPRTASQSKAHTLHHSGRYRISLHSKTPRVYIIYRIDDAGNASYQGQYDTLRRAKKEAERLYALDVDRVREQVRATQRQQLQQQEQE